MNSPHCPENLKVLKKSFSEFIDEEIEEGEYEHDRGKMRVGDLMSRSKVKAAPKKSK